MEILNMIDWNNATWILIIIIGIYIIKRIMKNRTFMRMGMTSRNMLLFANLKNYVNGMEETQRTIYENMLHGILKANDIKEEIIAIEDAADELHILDSIKCLRK